MSKRFLKQYCTKSFRKIRHRKGFGVHSPFAYNLITKVIEETCSYYAYQQVEDVWRTQICNRLTPDDFQLRKPISEKYGKLLFRLVNRFRPETIFEYKSSWGISTLYLYLGNPRARLFCAEPDPYVFNFSKKVLTQEKQNISFENFNFPEGLSEYLTTTKDTGFICIHRLSEGSEYDSVYKYLSLYLNDNTILFVEGIRSDNTALNAWYKFISDERIRVTMDLFDAGIAVCNPKLNKQDYIVAF
ncbi:hypothetical protein [Coprobacter sp.]